MRVKCNLNRNQIRVKEFNRFRLNFSNKIKHHALLVLEENKSLNEQNDLLRLKFVETQKKYLQESELF